MSQKLEQIIKEFINKNQIGCSETIYQTDKVIQNAYELIEDLCNEVGYWQDPDEE